MLENSLFESKGRTKTRKRSTVLLSSLIHVVTIAALILIPLLRPDALPALSAASSGIPLPPVPRPIEIVQVVKPLPEIQPTIRPLPGELIAPTVIPDTIATIIDPPESSFVPPAARNTDGIGKILSAIAQHQNEAEALPPPPPPVPPAPTVSAPIRVGGEVQRANLVFQVKPTYPEILRRARVQGTVTLEATIAKDGQIENLRVLSGHPFLAQAAIDAVKQWRYRPTLLNGEPVEVVTNITVTFTLQ
jgi:protein TonB